MKAFLLILGGLVLGGLVLAVALKIFDALASRSRPRTDLSDREAVRNVLARYKDLDD